MQALAFPASLRRLVPTTFGQASGPQHLLLVVAGFMLVLTCRAEAIRWDFEQDDDTQGWVARDGRQSQVLAPRLASQVRDGVWRILPGEFSHDAPAIGLISPEIRRDSGLYDRLQLRLRVIHTRPYQSEIQLLWRNSWNEALGAPGLAPPETPEAEIRWHVFDRMIGTTYPTDWEVIGISDLRAEDYLSYPQGGGQPSKGRIMWEGELIDLVVNLFLSYRYPAHPEDIPEAVEIDWIWLTGVGEQLAGETGPPGFGSPVSFGEQFSEPTFTAIVDGIGSPKWVPMAFLGDVEGDGDLDVVSMWSTDGWDRLGWVVAANDGTGSFAPGRVAEGAAPFFLGAGDLDGDGLVDLALNDGSDDLRILHNAADDGFVLSQELDRALYLAVGDAEPDGDLDVWTRLVSGEGAQVWLNDGEGRFDRSLVIGQDLVEMGFHPFIQVQHLPGPTAGLLWRPPLDDLGKGYWVTRLTTEGEEVREHLGAAVSLFLVRYAGDTDGDGDTDLVVSNSRNAAGCLGLTLMRNLGQGQMESLVWLGDVGLADDVQFLDVDGDGVLDPVFVDINMRDRALVVGKGNPTGLPTVVGRYPLEGSGGLVLGGDVDGDGDADLVVLERSGPGGKGGLHVLLNRLSERPTLVRDTPGRSAPAAFQLGSAYPNPFNPQTCIPLTVPADTGPVQVTVHNLLGQPIRTLVSGRLSPGYHAVPWDGLDEAGQAVSSGVYLYRLEAGPYSATRKMVKTQ